MKLFSPPAPEIIRKLDFKNPATWIATWFGCGLMHPGPGTWGTLGALPIGLILLVLGGKAALIAGIILIIPIGLWASARFEAMVETHDNSMIVIDEAAGLWITLLACTLTPLSIILSFALFRFFDILKPWPISWCDKNIGGAKGVMFDDIAAGLFAALTLFLLETYAFTG
ncbi:MAG: phosphatidylglycerophosphatase A [Micavibrio sp.]